MEWQEIEVDGRHTVKFTDLPYVPLMSPSQSSDSSDLFIGRKLGGILRHGEWGWLARNSVLQIVSLRNGQTISCYEFCESRGYESCCIKCVEEIYPSNPEIMLLAVVLESFRGPGGGCSYVAVYSVEFSKVLHNIELSLHLTCARFMEASVCRRSLLQNFDGCLAVGSEEGVVVLLNLNVQKLSAMQNDIKEDGFVPCHIVDYSLPLTEVHRNFRQCQLDGIHFGLQIQVIESPCSIQCILPIDLILGLAVGFEDGRLALYDLMELQIFYVALPNPEVTMSALVKMDFLEPPDDPRPCLFIWTLHENGENLHAVLHSLMYEKRLIDEEESLTYFETFQNCSVRLQLPLEATKSVALACQAISSRAIHGEDDVNCLCIISWLSVLEGKNKLLIFDLNQWYKEEMPFLIEYGKQPNYLAGFILDGECCGLQTLVNSNNIAHFNSMQRFEEHFYPNSLSLESLLLHTEGVRRYNWEGAQNRVVNLLRSSNAAIFLEPNFYFNEVIRTRLMPQFIELNMNSTFSRNAKYEILLSVALEHNCVSLLRDCAKSWIDGSFMGNFSAATGLSLSTLTDWIWNRATCIKTRCNDLCKSLFDHQGYPLDSREQKELSFITRQLKLLAELLQEILVYAKKQIPERVFNDLANKQSSLSMASSYQDILLWLLNIGLLPEAAPHNDKLSTRNAELIPYPYEDLKEFYKTKRLYYGKINESFISKKTGSCKLLFIDSFIEHVCKGNVLHEYWLENEGNGLYPPNSLESMLRVMLVPDLKYDNKCAILLYFFLDLNTAIDEVIYKDVVANFIKFPSVFKLSAPLIKTVQTFWNLDHDHYLPAVDEFISPFNKNQNYPQWQVELLIEVLLNQKASNLALRILESQPSLISPLLKLNTLLANDLISQAFHFVRSKHDDSLLETFFTRCLFNGQFGVIRDLALSEQEGLILQNILKKMKSPGAESLHFVYLLQKSKYIEAVSYMEEMANRAKGLKTALNQANDMDTPNLVLSAFNTTMTPVTQGLTDVYFRIRNKIKKKEIDNDCPVPLSCQLIKQNANSLLGGIYHSSALSAHFATYYWGEMEEQTKQTKHLLNSNNAPFLRRPQIDTNSRDYLNKNSISYPQAYKVNEKRTLIESGVLENDSGDERLKLEHKLNPKKKRRLIGQEIVDDLQHFMKMNKSLPATEFSFGPEQQAAKEMRVVGNETFDLLLHPLNNKTKEMELPKTKETEIQGILKTHTVERGQPREVLNEEEKNIRFRLPSIEANNSQLQREEVITIDENVEQPKQIVVKEKNPKEESPNFKNFSRSLSVESSKSSSSKSADNFYSPLSSQNNSKLDCSNLSLQSILSGPQPRKPLARYSAERSEKSLTPEKELESLDKTQYVTALESNLKTQISPRPALKNLTTEESLNKEYVTALESNFKTKISPRPALKHLSTEDSVNKEPSNLAYVTAKETLSQPLTQSQSSKTNQEDVLQTTSGYGSLGTTLAESKIREFLPKGSSSKIHAIASLIKDTKPAKLSECSTVLGSFTTLESISSNNTNTISSLPSLIKSPNELNKDEQKRHMFETTLGMSTYDLTILETSSLQQTKSSLKVTDKEGITKTEEIKEDIKIKHIESTGKYMIEEEKEEEKRQSPLLIAKEESNDVCIVLSSSSSSASATSLNHQTDAEEDYSDPLSEYEREDEQDYEKEDEYENDDDDDNIEENIEDEEREDLSENDNEINMEDESDISNDNLQDDYDEELNDNDISMEDSEDSSAKANAEIIQLLEDSSADEGHQEGSYYDESESDDVKYLEDEISTDINEDYIEMKEREDDKKKPSDKSSSLTADHDEKLTTSSTEKPEELKPSGSSPSVKNICINEIVSTTTKDLEKENKSKDLKQIDEEKCEEQQEEKKKSEQIATEESHEKDQCKQGENKQNDTEATKKSSEEQKQEVSQVKEQKETKESKAEYPSKQLEAEKSPENKKQEKEQDSKEREKQEEGFKQQNTPASKESLQDQEELNKKMDACSEPKLKQSHQTEEASKSSQSQASSFQKSKENVKETVKEATSLKLSREDLEEPTKTKSPVKEKTIETIENMPENSTEKTENNESLEDPPMFLRMDESNEETKVSNKKEEEKIVNKEISETLNVQEAEQGSTEQAKGSERKESNEDSKSNTETKNSKKEKQKLTNEQKSETPNQEVAKKELIKVQEAEQVTGERNISETKTTTEENNKEKLNKEKLETTEQTKDSERDKSNEDSKSSTGTKNSKKGKQKITNEQKSEAPNQEIDKKELIKVQDVSNEETKELNKEEEEKIVNKEKLEATEQTKDSEREKSNTQTKNSKKEKQKITNEQKSETSNQEIDKKELIKVQEAERSTGKRNIPETKTTIEEKNKEKLEEKSNITAGDEKEDNPHKDSSLLQNKRTISRGSSVPPKELEPSTANLDSTPLRKTRGISVPPQAILESEEYANMTPTTRRNLRASSLQPKSSKINDSEMATPRKIKKTPDNENSETRITRGSSVPPGAVEGKITARRRSVLLEAINEDGSLLDSPSTRTRLRSRLNSGESEVDSPVIQQKRTRKLSSSLNTQETLLTPKRTRRDSITSQPEASVSTATPRTLRARSVLSVQEEEEEIMHTPKRKRRESVSSHPETTTLAGTPRSLRSRSVLSMQEEELDDVSRPSTPKTINKKKETEDEQKLDESLTEIKESPTSEATYSSSRRLTRTQLAVMEKSASLVQALRQQPDTTISSPKNKRPRSRSTRSSNLNADSDDAESVSSKLSTASSVTGTKRRVTRSSVKEMDEAEDDGASVASSMGSEKVLKTRRSKDVNSPNTTLTTIPEEAPVETKKRGRPTKH